jgi:hypothetical protein
MSEMSFFFKERKVSLKHTEEMNRAKSIVTDIEIMNCDQ